VGEGHFQPRRFTCRHDFVEKDGRVEAQRLCGAATRCARLSLYPADRTDRLLPRGLTAGEARKKRHRNDDQPIQHAPARPNTIGPNSGTMRARAQCRRICFADAVYASPLAPKRRSPAAIERTSMACKYVSYWPLADIPSCTAHVRFRG